MIEEFHDKHIHPHFEHDDIIRNNLELILDDGDNYITDTELLSLDQNTPTDYKFAIYIQLNDAKTMRKKRIYKSLPDDEVYDCDETSYKFILVEVKYGDSTIKLNFDNVKTTYYVVNNEFNSDVIGYLLAKEFDIELPEQYTVCILDQNVSRVEFNERQILRLNKDDYEIITVGNSENDESENDESETDESETDESTSSNN